MVLGDASIDAASHTGAGVTVGVAVSVVKDFTSPYADPTFSTVYIL